MRNQVQIYKAEKEAGLTIEDLNKVSFSYLVPVLEAIDFDQTKIGEKVLNLAKIHASTEQDIVLYPIKSVLVTTNWNSNDDVFHPHEVWAARLTAVDRPFNYEHNCDDIIGHTTDCYAVDDEGVEIAASTALDDLPSKFHLVNRDVLYQHWNKKHLQERMDGIIAGISKNEWFVSVEALATGFDYVLRDEKENQKIVARNAETSFITKSLKCYNGKGVIEISGSLYQVGRLHRGIVFSGKGLTKKPANPESIIFAKKYELISANKNLGYDTSLNYKTKEVKLMDEKEYQKQIENLKNEVTKLQASLQEANVKDYKAQAEKLSKDLTEVQAKLTSNESLLNTAKEELKASKESFENTEKSRKELAEKLSKLETEKKDTERFSLVVSKLKLDEVKAKKLVENLKSLSDEAFTANIDMQAEILASAVKPQEEVKEKKVTESEKADEKALEKVEASTEKQVSGVVTEKENGVEEVRASIGSFLSNYLSDEDETESK